MKFLCTETQANKARKLQRETGIRHDVIDVSKGGGKGYQVVVKNDGQIPYEHLSAGNVTILYTADGGQRRLDEFGNVEAN